MSLPVPPRPHLRPADPPVSPRLGPQLVIDKDLAKLPRRPTDNAFVVRAKAPESNPLAPTRVFKLNSVDGGKVFIKRCVPYPRPGLRSGMMPAR